MEAMVVGLPKRIHWRRLIGDSNPSIKAALASHKQGYELSAALQAGMEWCTSESLLISRQAVPLSGKLLGFEPRHRFQALRLSVVSCWDSNPAIASCGLQGALRLSVLSCWDSNPVIACKECSASQC